MRAVLLSLALLAAKPVFSETLLDAELTVRVVGISVGRITLVQNGTERAYIARGRLEPTAIVATLKDVFTVMRAEGRFRQGQMYPTSYTEDINTGERVGHSEARFGAGDKRIDPLSAMIDLVRSRPASAGCGMTRKMWDGTRGHVLILKRSASGKGIARCFWRLERTSGYTAEQLAKMSGYDINMTYRVEAGHWVFSYGEVDTIYGSATLVPTRLRQAQ
ncbi:MAG: hypothetical protein CSA72_14200 [Rhodobacterales bacterium]|nr:MAG: hypothetical protein CR993_06395 [Rhodobacterales bacterium]PIE09169.1 MAG: hypothetical protein CSA72_14200 [Rhodobacterales bacterium]